MSEDRRTDNKVKLDTDERRGYKERLKGGLAFQKAFGRVEEWQHYIEVLSHNFYGGKKLDGDSPIINLVAARVRAQPPKLAFGIPSFEVKSYGAAPSPNSEAAIAAALALVWEQEGFDETTRKVTLDWPLFGIGVGFVGWEKGHEGDIIDSKRRLFGFLPAGVTDSISRATGGKSDVLAASEERRFKMLLKERIFLERVSPFNFIIDPCADAWDDAQFMARRISLPRERAVLMFGKHTPTDLSSGNVALWKGGGSDDVFGDEPDKDLDAKIPDSVKRVRVWELWDITTRRTVYLDANNGEVIGPHAYEWRSPHPGFPFVPLLWDEVPDTVMPTGLAAAIMPGNEELQLIRKRHLSEIRKAIGKWRVGQSVANNRDAMAALRSDVDGEPVIAEEGDIEALTFHSIPPEHFTVEKQVRQDIDEVTHTTAYDSGSMPQVKRSATESAYAQSSSDAVSAWRKTAVERFASAVAERMLAYMLTVFDEPIPLRIANNDPNHLLLDAQGNPVLEPGPDGMLHPKYAEVGQMVDFMFTGIDHAGAFRIKTIEDTMMSMAKDVERMQLAQAFQLFAEQPWFKAREAAAHFFSTMPSVRDPHKFVMTDEEMQEMAAQQQAAMPAVEPGMPGTMPPDPFAGNPSQQGPGSGNMTADTLAAMMGASAPMTGDNGLGGADLSGGGY